MKAKADPGIRLNAWECRLLHRALSMFVASDRWSATTEGCFQDLTKRLGEKLLRESNRCVRREGD